jgi:YesN/AraC family two-component response regulator
MGALSVMDEYAPITEGVLYVDELRDSPGKEPLYSIQQEKQLLNNIRAGNVSEVEAQLEGILSACARDGTTVHSHKLFQQLVSTAYRASEQPKSGADKEAEKLTLDLATDISALHSRERDARLMDLFRRLAECNAREKSDRQSAVYQRIRELIERNYDKDLSLTSIGQQLGYSPSYISWVFKEVSNTNYIDYLHEYRIAQAKLLLDSTELPILEIASRIGYSNANTFIKRFKKQEGITPGQYRTSARELSVDNL